MPTAPAGFDQSLESCRSLQQKVGPKASHVPDGCWIATRHRSQRCSGQQVNGIGVKVCAQRRSKFQNLRWQLREIGEWLIRVPTERLTQLRIDPWQTQQPGQLIAYD